MGENIYIVSFVRFLEHHVRKAVLKVESLEIAKQIIERDNPGCVITKIEMVETVDDLEVFRTVLAAYSCLYSDIGIDATDVRLAIFKYFRAHDLFIAVDNGERFQLLTRKFKVVLDVSGGDKSL